MVHLVESMTGDHPGRPCLVVCNVPSAAGIARADGLGVPTAVIDHRPYKGDRAAFEVAIEAALSNARADILCLAGFMRIFTTEFTARWLGRCLNIHPSLLPKYPGLNTHARALSEGDTEAGCSVHEVTGELDSGPILGQGRVPIKPGDDADTLAARVLAMEHQLYPAVLRRFVSGDRTPVLLP